MSVPNNPPKYERVVIELNGDFRNSRVYLEKSGEDLPVMSLVIKASGRRREGPQMTCWIELPPRVFRVKGKMDATIETAEPKWE